MLSLLSIILNNFGVRFIRFVVQALSRVKCSFVTTNYKYEIHFHIKDLVVFTEYDFN